jgi:hypothetical protein
MRYVSLFAPGVLRLGVVSLVAAGFGLGAVGARAVQPAEAVAAAPATPIIQVSPTRSYVRLANMGDTPAINTVEIYGLRSRTTLGSFQIVVPAKASLQIRPTEMIQTFVPLDLDQFLAVYVSNGHTRQYWQHVRFDARSGAFSDAGVCTAPPAPDAAPMALNVHTSRIPAYVSFVTAHNFSDVPGQFQAVVYDAATGARLGAIDVDLGPRQTLSETGMWFHNTIGLFFPREDQLHLNVEFVTRGPSTGARLAVGHEVVNALTGTSVNLSNPCVF